MSQTTHPSWRIHTACYEFVATKYYILLLVGPTTPSSTNANSVGGPLWIWIGDNAAEFGPLALSFPPTLNSPTPLATTTQLLGFAANDPGHQISTRLAKRYRRPVYCSENLSAGAFQLLLKYNRRRLMTETETQLQEPPNLTQKPARV
ncbi:proteasome (prosome, macropain) assembly chaperone 4 [Dispira simplex]|nr:proteasome (prosome, macropain) assembly chaperone 4 [Dispira simplex]